MKERSLYWAPRVLGILAILFMMIFSLDCFDFKDNFRNVLTCLLMSNLPALGIAIILFIAWKWELAGGMLFVMAFFFLGFFFQSFTGNFASLIVIVPFLLTGILFIVHYFHDGKTPAEH